MIRFIKEVHTVWRRQSRGWHVVVVWMIVTRFLRLFIEQYASIYIRLLGASPAQLGAVRSTAGVAGMAISLPLGIAQDRYSLRRIYLVGITLLTLMPFLFAIAPSWQWLIPAIVLMGLGLQLGGCSVICDVSLSNRDRATGRAICEGFGALPTLFAPALAALFITWLGGIGVGSIRTLYWFYFVIGAIPTLYAFLNLPEITRSQQVFGKLHAWSELREVFKRGTALKRYVAFMSLSHFTRMMLITFVYPYAFEIGSATPLILGGISTAMTLAEVLFSTVFGRLADRIGRKNVYYLLTPAFVASNLLFIYTPTSFYLVAAGFFFGFRMIASVVHSSMAPELVPEQCIGRWRGIIGLMMGLAGMASSIAGGYIWEIYGAHHVFSVASIVDVVIVLPLLYIIPETLGTQINKT